MDYTYPGKWRWNANNDDYNRKVADINQQDDVQQ